MRDRETSHPKLPGQKSQLARWLGEWPPTTGKTVIRVTRQKSLRSSNPRASALCVGRGRVAHGGWSRGGGITGQLTGSLWGILSCGVLAVPAICCKSTVRSMAASHGKAAHRHFRPFLVWRGRGRRPRAHRGAGPSCLSRLGTGRRGHSDRTHRPRCPGGAPRPSALPPARTQNLRPGASRERPRMAGADRAGRRGPVEPGVSG